MLLLVLVGSMGCSTTVGEFTILSSHNVEVSRIDLKKVDLRPHTGESHRFWILFIPVGRKPSINEATDRCLQRGRGDYMLNARVYDNSWTCLLFTWGSYVVRGEVGLSTKGGARDVVTEEAPPPAVAPPPAASPPPAAPPPPADSPPPK